MSKQKPAKGGLPNHIAVIMDGNGRWAKARGLPRVAGHHAGTANIKHLVRACIALKIPYMTIYAFSTENWNRPRWEVGGLMRILAEFLDRELEELHADGVHLRHLGELEGVEPRLSKRVEHAIELTRNNTAITLAVAFNYGGRADVVRAVQRIVASGVRPEDVTEELISANLYTAGMPDPDLIIRTGGDWRLSNFLVWQASYSEYWTTPMFWPDFKPEHLHQALSDFSNRERRFGMIAEEKSQS